MLKLGKTVKREILGEDKDLLSIPNLIKMQLDSYEMFLQRNKDIEDRNPNVGLESVFRSVFPIESPNGNVVLEYMGYTFGDMKYDENEARKRDATYGIVTKAIVRLIYVESGEVREKEVYMGDIPLMTKRGTFIINGAERVVVSQIHKSPGVAFSVSERMGLYLAKIIPDKGVWLEFELDQGKEVLYLKIDRKKELLVTVFLRALGYESNEEILKLFYSVKEVDLEDNERRKEIEESANEVRLAEAIIDKQTGELIFESGQELISQDIEKLVSFGIHRIRILDSEELNSNNIILRCLELDEITNKKDAIVSLYNATKVGTAVTLDNSEKEFEKLFFDVKKYSLGVVGRYKLNQKLYDRGEKLSNEMVLSREDIIRVIKYLLLIYEGKRLGDDIDHLGNRRVRCVGELLINQLKVGFSRMERLVKEKMNTEDVDEITPQKLISIKPVTAVMKEFFGSSQLSQYMDETNPLAELTHKRRLSALGPGGLSRDRAGFEVRDVHYSHYGKVCPIETPEGPNIGLILSLCTFAEVNEYGFLVSPYQKIESGKLTDKVEYLTAVEEDKYYITEASAEMDEEGNLKEDLVVGRSMGGVHLVLPSQIDYMDISSKQIISVSTALIPFLEHNDANRALMGSNMQRQAVPLMIPESPIVGTGMERVAALDSGVCVRADRGGEVVKVSWKEVSIKVGGGEEDNYQLIRYRRTNQNTCFIQKPVVKLGDHVDMGDILADGPACDGGELALGKNVKVAFMSLDGGNFEDAIIVSSRMVKDDVFTSIYIEEFVVDARETKLGSEKITRDIPNLSEDVFANLDEDGIVRVGARVSAGDILVGKVTPKGETESTPEYKLLHSIFGEKAREVKDTSLRVPNGNEGIVIEVNYFKRDNNDDLPPGVEELVKVFIASKRKLSEGDKMAGRHGNKGVISQIIPEEDMPYMENGEMIDIVLNPLGVPSRMNLGQILELHLGWVGYKMGKKYGVPVFEGIHAGEVEEKLQEAGLPSSGKTRLYDGKTGVAFENEVTVGVLYMLKLSHMVDDKIHARSTGPYSLVTQQPLGGKAQFGGQRLGEMEVWALEAYGAAHTLQEFLTVKADDMLGRAKIYENIVKGDMASAPGIPESFNVLLQELRGLGLDLSIYDVENNPLGLTDKDIENLNKMRNKES